MGSCKSSDGVAEANGELGVVNTVHSSNPFYDLDSVESGG
jgi:hypothetical protein